MKSLNSAGHDWIANRPSALSPADEARFDAEINSRAFFVAHLAEARVLAPVRKIYDDYMSNRISMHDAQKKLRHLCGRTRSESLGRLAATGRLETSLRVQKAMAQAVGEYQVAMDPDVIEALPYVEYRSYDDGYTRPEHRRLNGRIFRKTDPFLRSHWPGAWDYNCRCYMRELSAAEAAAAGKPVEPAAPAQVYDARSGFKFDPGAAFKLNEMGHLDVLTQKNMINSLGEDVRAGRIKQIGLLLNGGKTPLRAAKPDSMDELVRQFAATRDAARASVRSAGLDPDNMPDFRRQDQAYGKNKERHDLPAEVRKTWQSVVAPVGEFSRDLAERAGLKQTAIRAELGNGDYGITHNWIHHKEVFCDPEESRRILRATLGNPKAQVAVSLRKSKNGGVEKRIAFYEPATKAFALVKVVPGDSPQLVSWHRAESVYADNAWTPKQ